MLIIKIVSGGEIRIPLDDIESISEIEPATGMEREPPGPFTCALPERQVRCDRSPEPRDPRE
jgi:hypothetical protein